MKLLRCWPCCRSLHKCRQSVCQLFQHFVGDKPPSKAPCARVHCLSQSASTNSCCRHGERPSAEAQHPANYVACVHLLHKSHFPLSLAPHHAAMQTAEMTKCTMLVWQRSMTRRSIDSDQTLEPLSDGWAVQLHHLGGQPTAPAGLFRGVLVLVIYLSAMLPSCFQRSPSLLLPRFAAAAVSLVCLMC